MSIAADSVRLTSLSSCAGCAAKIAQGYLAAVLGELPTAEDPRLLVGADTCDDAGVYLLDDQRAMIQTVDFFTPIVDDPYDYGQIAAANAISDVYAMGGRPVTAMNLVGMPLDKLSADVIGQILRGGADKAREAQCCIVGGHSIRSPEPIYGMAVTGMVDPDAIIANTNARAGDVLVLTKPLGTGIITTAIKRNCAPPSLEQAALRSMTTLNTPGADLAEAGLVRCGTDVTGFGLLGHLANICRGSNVSAEIEANSVPLLGPELFELVEAGCIPGGSKTNLSTADEITDWHIPLPLRTILCDAQTSGGLLLCVPPHHLAAVRRLLIRRHTLTQAVIGRLIPRKEFLICVR